MGQGCKRRVTVWLMVVGLTIGWISVTGGAHALAAESQAGAGPKVGAWTGGAAIGLLGNTPDGTAFGLNFNAETFLDQRISLGPLVQLGFTGDMTLVGASGQGKYWFDLSNTDNRVKLNLQAGVGFVHADMFGRDDTSFLIPIGIGVDYKLNETIALTSAFLLNFTDLNVAGNRTTVMPGWTVGFRF